MKNINTNTPETISENTNLLNSTIPTTSLLNTIIHQKLPANNYSAIITSFQEISPISTTDPANPVSFKPYILIKLTIDTNLPNNTLSDKIYANRIPYIMRSLAKQFNTYNVTFAELLTIATKQHFDINLTYHDTYGQQISYQHFNNI